MNRRYVVEQNEFRKNRLFELYIFILMSILRNRIYKKQSTFGYIKIKQDVNIAVVEPKMKCIVILLSSLNHILEQSIINI